MAGPGYAAFQLTVANSVLIAATFTDLIALILLYAGIAKLRDLTGFRILLLGYGGLPSGLAGILGIATPFAEIALGSSLLILPVRSAAAAGAAGLFGVAAVVIGISLAIGRVPEVCGCLSTKTGKPPNVWTVARLLAVAASLIVAATSQVRLVDTWIGTTTPLILSVESIIAWLIASRLVPIVVKSNRMAHVLELRNTKRSDLDVNGTRTLDQGIERPSATNELGG